MKKFAGLFIVFIVIIATSCSEKGQPILHKNITGAAGSVIVVIPEVTWQDTTGRLLQRVLTQPQLSLPQAEPIFDLINVPPDGFKDIFKSTRNILQVNISPEIKNAGVGFTDNVWAFPQATVQIDARTKEDFLQLFNENSDKIIGYFLKAERERLAMNYKDFNETSVSNTLFKNYDININCAPGYKITAQGKDFVWIRYETPNISQAIMIYWFPYSSDSTFTANYLLFKRDSFLRANVPGPLDGTYMATERRADPIFQITKHNGNYASDIRGLWRVEKDFMGGPFIMLAELDAQRQRVVVADGYVYAPSKNKRNYIRQIEAMVYSLSFKDQEINDRLNKQAAMGN